MLPLGHVAVVYAIKLWYTAIDFVLLLSLCHEHKQEQPLWWSGPGCKHVSIEYALKACPCAQGCCCVDGPQTVHCKRKSTAAVLTIVRQYIQYASQMLDQTGQMLDDTMSLQRFQHA